MEKATALSDDPHAADEMMTATMAVFMTLRMIPLFAVTVMAAMIGVCMPSFDHHDPCMAVPRYDTPRQAH